MRYALLLIPLVLAGCATPDTVSDPNGVALQDVIQRVKLEIGLYQQYENANYRRPAEANACKGYANFRITKVVLTLQTLRMTDNEASAAIGVSIPTGYKLALSADGHHISKNTSTLVFSMFPAGPADNINAEFVKATLTKVNNETPLSSALIGLRTAILAQSDNVPCFHLRQNDNPVSDTVTFVFEIENKGNGGAGFTYTIFSLNASHAVDKDNMNKIEVTFEPYLNPLVNGKPPQTPAIPRGASAGEGFTD